MGDDWVDTVWILLSEIEVVFNNGGFFRRAASHQRGLEGELIVEEWLSIGKFKALDTRGEICGENMLGYFKEIIWSKSETKVVGVVDVDIFLVDNWSQMDLTGLGEKD